MKAIRKLFSAALVGVLALTATVSQAAEPLSSWNDGTLWAEQPTYFQMFFISDRINALAPQHPEWQDKEPFASVLKGDLNAALAGGGNALLEMVMATQASMTTEEFERIVNDWITTAKHPESGKLFTEMIYRPMRELLDYLRANGFKTFIVSGGGIEFMRPWTERVYGIPPEQVVGSSGGLKYEHRGGNPVLVKLPELSLYNDNDGKPIGIQRHIGRRPIFAAGNSDGDFEMLEWTTAGDGARFGGAAPRPSRTCPRASRARASCARSSTM